jgi:hypothetical protein
VCLARNADPEVDVRVGVLRLAARAKCADCGALGDGLALPDGDGPEVNERRGVAVGRLDRHRSPAAGHRSGERHRSGRRRDDGRPGSRTDVDAAVLTGRVGVRPEDEGSQHRAVDRPGPGVRGRRADLERQQDRKQTDETLHRSASLLSH